VTVGVSVVPVIDKYHPPLPPLEIIMARKNKSNLKEGDNMSTQVSLDYAKANFLALYLGFQAIDWGPLNLIQDSDEVVEHFQLKLDEVIQKTVPRTRKRMNKYPPWFSRDIIRVIKDKEKTRKKFKRILAVVSYAS